MVTAREEAGQPRMRKGVTATLRTLKLAVALILTVGTRPAPGQQEDLDIFLNDGAPPAPAERGTPQEQKVSPPEPGAAGSETSGTGPAADATGPQTGEARTTPDVTADEKKSAASPSLASGEGPGLRNRRSAGIEEIIVTAQKRAENVQDVPITIDAFSGDQLDIQGATDPSKLQLITPGLIYDNLSNFHMIYLRGVGTDAFIPSADLSVVTYVDGIYFPFSFNVARSFGSVERVEVIKGPQGTLFGRNATGGAINIITKQPSEDSYTGSVQAGFGSFNEVTSRLFVTGPLYKTLSFSVGGFYNQRNDYYHPTADSPVHRFRPSEEKSVTAKLKWAPLEALDATLNGLMSSSQGVGASLFVQEKPKPLGTQLGLQAEKNDYEASTNQAFFSSDTSVASLTANVRPGPFDIKSITAYQEMEGEGGPDFDGTGIDLVSFPTAPNRGHGMIGRGLTQELQFLSSDQGWLSDRNLKWVAGFFFLTSTAGLPNLDLKVGGVQSLPSGTFPGLPSGTKFGLSGLLDTSSYAGFTQGTWTPLSWLELTLGGRYQYERRRVHRSSFSLVTTTNGQDSLTPIFVYPDDSLAKGDFSPKVSVGVRPFEDVLVFASWQKAFKSGSFNIININVPPTIIRPEEVTAIELGFKSDLFDRRVRINGAIYRTQIHDLQSQFISLQSGGAVHFENADQATIRGADLDVTWAVTPALILNVGGTALHGIYDKFLNASGFDNNTGQFSQNNDYSGNRIVRNPKFTGVAALNYSLPLFSGTFDLGNDYYYNDGFFYDSQNATKEDAYYVTNVHLSYLYEPWNLRVTFLGDNLNSARRHLFRFSNDFGTVGNLAAPRTFGGRLNWDF